MSFSPAAIANKFWRLAAAQGRQLTPMQVQKLVYFAHGWHLGLSSRPLSWEHPQAWLYGPVFPSLYQDVKQWGGGPIPQPIIEFSEVEDPFAIALIERVWDVYGDKSAAQLSQMSHDPKGPWKQARDKSNGARGVPIHDADVQRYFANLSANDDR